MVKNEFSASLQGAGKQKSILRIFYDNFGLTPLFFGGGQGELVRGWRWVDDVDNIIAIPPFMF